MAIKPILFNTPMVRAIQEDRKTVTRRVIKYSCPAKPECTLDDFIGAGDPQLLVGCSPYQSGDILWVRETWVKIDGEFIYKANLDASSWRARFIENQIGWRPSIHMPKEAARLFLLATGVRVERLQDITEEQAETEGAYRAYPYTEPGTGETVYARDERATYRGGFSAIWDSTIKPADLPRYGWEANPWVWVIGFERCGRPEGFPGGHHE